MKKILLASLLILLTGSLTLLVIRSKRSANEDVENAIKTHQDEICAQLQIECPFPITIEIYPDQASFDAHVINQDYRGFYAISGRGKIQMVSPRVPLPNMAIPYNERVLIAVHEFVHLALDEIDPDLPDWLDEGAAIYLGPHAIYDRACRQAFPFERVPGIQDLTQSYSSIPAADLFVYTLVRFIIERDGMENFNQLLRSPSRIREFSAMPPSGFESEWNSFLKQTCSGPQK